MFYRARAKRKPRQFRRKGAVLEKARPIDKVALFLKRYACPRRARIIWRIARKQKEVRGIFLESANCNRRSAYFLGARCLRFIVRSAFAGAHLWGAPFKRKALSLRKCAKLHWKAHLIINADFWLSIVKYTIKVFKNIVIF